MLPSTITARSCFAIGMRAPSQAELIVDLVSGAIGDDVILWGCHVFCKPPVEGYETPWHQDGHYWDLDPPLTLTAFADRPVAAALAAVVALPARRNLDELARRVDALVIMPSGPEPPIAFSMTAPTAMATTAHPVLRLSTW